MLGALNLIYEKLYFAFLILADIEVIDWKGQKVSLEFIKGVS